MARQGILIAAVVLTFIWQTSLAKTVPALDPSLEINHDEDMQTEETGGFLMNMLFGGFPWPGPWGPGGAPWGGPWGGPFYG